MPDHIEDPRRVALGHTSKINVGRILWIAISVLVVVAILFFFTLFAAHRRTPSPADTPTKQGLMVMPVSVFRA